MPERERLPQILERNSFLSRLGLGLPPRGSRIVYPEPEEISNESFMSPHDSSEHGDHIPGPEAFGQQLRLQRPVVRPVSGLYPEHLTSLYGDIRKWRSHLKALNLQISEEQQTLYDDIANGASVRGFLLIGRGVRFLPGVRMIEGRSKDDVRWEELQHDGGTIGHLSFWLIVGIVSVVLAGASEFHLRGS